MGLCANYQVGDIEKGPTWPHEQLSPVNKFHMTRILNSTLMINFINHNSAFSVKIKTEPIFN